jgi:Domain of unknown function (DUF4439)
VSAAVRARTADAIAALQLALAGEHAAVFGYGVVGARCAPADAALAVASYSTHRRRRDRLTEIVQHSGGTPVAARPGYLLPDRLNGPEAPRRLARRLEHGCAAQYAFAVGRTTGDARLFAAEALTDCAVRGLEWGARSEPFPGIGDL